MDGFDTVESLILGVAVGPAGRWEVDPAVRWVICLI